LIFQGKQHALLRNGAQEVEKILGVEPDLQFRPAVFARDAFFGFARFQRGREDLDFARHELDADSARTLIRKLGDAFDGAFDFGGGKRCDVVVLLRQNALVVGKISGQLARDQQPRPEFEEQVIPSAVEEEKGPITPGEIPVTIVIEAGSVQMTMDQLLQLEPGNLLELNIRPESGVDLTINGKIVGKGELIKLGETLGVRVLKLGKSVVA